MKVATQRKNGLLIPTIGYRVKWQEAGRERIEQDLAKMLLIHPPRSAPDSWHSDQAENAECRSCDGDATARLIRETVKRRSKSRNNTSLANVSSCSARINVWDRKQGYRKKVANGPEMQGGVGKGSEPKKGAEERWKKCVRFERQWAEHALKEMPLPPSPPSPLRTTQYTHIERCFLCTVSIQLSRLPVNHSELETVEEGTGGPGEIKRGACWNNTGSMCLLRLTPHSCSLVT